MEVNHQDEPNNTETEKSPNSTWPGFASNAILRLKRGDVLIVADSYEYSVSKDNGTEYVEMYAFESEQRCAPFTMLQLACERTRLKFKLEDVEVLE